MMMRDMASRFKYLARSFKDELSVYRLVLGDSRTPWIAKILLGVAIGYFLLPIDIIPDFIPVIGQLDDIIIVPLLVIAARRFIPVIVFTEC
jgi:uncharacterized membrane protein YkvA (DUF1232 family)